MYRLFWTKKKHMLSKVHGWDASRCEKLLPGHGLIILIFRNFKPKRQKPKPDTFNSKLNQYFTSLTSPLTSPCCLNTCHYSDWWTLHFISWNTKHTQKCNNSNREETSTNSTKRTDVGFPFPLSPFSPFEKKTNKNGLIVESWRQSFERK